MSYGDEVLKNMEQRKSQYEGNFPEKYNPL